MDEMFMDLPYCIQNFEYQCLKKRGLDKGLLKPLLCILDDVLYVLAFPSSSAVSNQLLISSGDGIRPPETSFSLITNPGVAINP